MNDKRIGFLSIPEKSIGAIHNWHDNNSWEHYQIVNGKAKKINEDVFYKLYDAGTYINQPLYVEDN